MVEDPVNDDTVGFDREVVRAALFPALELLKLFFKLRKLPYKEFMLGLVRRIVRIALFFHEPRKGARLLFRRCSSPLIFHL
jgi:hypothetical protein